MTTSRLETPDLSISVRELVEFVLRQGDLRTEFVGSSRAVAGTKGHQKVQKSRPESYQSEVALSTIYEVDGLGIRVQGRADGVYSGHDPVVIDEIKTTSKALETIEFHSYPQHWAQAKCYAYLYALEYQLPKMGVQLTYFQLDSAETKEFNDDFSFEQLSDFFFDLLQRYSNWAKTLKEWHSKRNSSIQTLSFPFQDYRAGQRNLSVAVYRSIQEQHNLFAQAPTGIGKTIAVLFPAVKALGEGLSSKVFYLTAKTIGRTVAQQAIEEMSRSGLKLKSLTLTAKEKICFEPEAACHPDECPYARGHFDRINDATADLFMQDTWTREVVESTAKKHRVCPFEFSLDLSLWADVVICDYNYVFDPRVSLRRFFENGETDFILLIDEAHNLADRARDMFSAELNKATFLALKRELKESWPKGAKLVSHINSSMLEIRKLCEVQPEKRLIQAEPIAKLSKRLRSFSTAAEKWLLENPQSPNMEVILDCYFEVLRYLRTEELFDDHYRSILQAAASDCRVRLYCLDPSELLAQATGRFRATIFFSATLSPLPYFMELYGAQPDDTSGELPSPFPKENLGRFVHHGIATSYKRRADSYEVIAQNLHNIVSSRIGNYLAYFPSYQYLRDVLSCFETLEVKCQTLFKHLRWRKKSASRFSLTLRNPL